MCIKFDREKLEKHQVWLYLIAVGAGLMVGVPLRPDLPDAFIYVPLGLLLFATFAQVPVSHVADAIKNRRYLAATVVANFIFVPAAVWMLAWIVPREPAILLGVFMVLLVPCTDWFIVFSHLGKGDLKVAIASTPVLLLGQFLLLPLYLWLFMGETFSDVIRAQDFVQVFLGLLALPLIAAAAAQLLAERRPTIRQALDTTAWFPVPCLTIVLFLVALLDGPTAIESFWGLERVALMFLLYLIVAAGIGALTGILFRLTSDLSRTLIFSVGTRNSFVVLPFVLALPKGWEAAVAIVVLQPLVELFGMLLYLRILPNWTPSRCCP